ADVGHRDHLLTHDHGPIALLVLDGVAHFVCSHSDGRHRTASIVSLTQPQCAAAGVIVIGEQPAHGLYVHVVDVVGSEDGVVDVAPGELPTSGHTAPLGARALHPRLCTQTEHQRSEHPHRLQWVDEVHG